MESENYSLQAVRPAGKPESRKSREAGTNKSDNLPDYSRNSLITMDMCALKGLLLFLSDSCFMSRPPFL